MGLGKTVQTVVFLYSLYKEVRVMRVIVMPEVLRFYVLSSLTLPFKSEGGRGFRHVTDRKFVHQKRMSSK